MYFQYITIMLRRLLCAISFLFLFFFFVSLEYRDGRQQHEQMLQDKQIDRQFLQYDEGEIAKRHEHVLQIESDALEILAMYKVILDLFGTWCSFLFGTLWAIASTCGYFISLFSSLMFFSSCHSPISMPQDMKELVDEQQETFDTIEDHIGGSFLNVGLCLFPLI